MIATDLHHLLEAHAADPFDAELMLAMADAMEERGTVDRRCKTCGGAGWRYDDHGGNIGVQSHCHQCRSTGRTTRDLALDAARLRVRAQPGYDGWRLTFASTAAATDPMLAEFVRVQIALARESHRRGAETNDQWRRVCDVTEWAGLLDLVPRRLGWTELFKERAMDGGEVHLEYECRDTGRNPCIVVSRGFISTVRGPFAALVENLPRIVASHPVTKVEVTDKRPMMSLQGGKFFWGGAIGQGLLTQHYIPLLSPLYDVVGRRNGREPVFFDTEDEAVAALGEAAMQDARRTAARELADELRGL